MVALQPIGRKPEVARHLRDHFIAAAIQVEAVDVIAAQERCQRRANILHIDAKLIGLVRIDFELDLRRVELQIAVGKDEEPAFARGLFDLRHVIDDLLIIADGGEKEMICALGIAASFGAIS